MTDTAVNETATTELVDTYFEMWRATDEGARTELVARVFTPDGRHVDQHADVAGHEEVAGMLAGVHAAYPGFTIERTSGIDRHGDQLRFAWRLASADGSLTLNGLDVAELAGDGRFARIAGFWGDLPAR